MKALRRICILLIAVGVAILLLKRDPSFDTVPFPANGLSVKLMAQLRSEGDYCLRVSMPTKNPGAPLGEETLTCSLTVTIFFSGKQVVQTEVKTLVLGSEFGWAGIQYFSGPTWHLNRGRYNIEVVSHGDCPAAIARGAALSLDQKLSHVTERFLAASLVHAVGIVSLGAGFIGLVSCELRKA
jgi:hypothetical protein